MNQTDWHAHRDPYLPPEDPERGFPWRGLIVGTIALGLWCYFLLFQLPAFAS